MLKRYQEEIDKIKGCLVKKKIGKRSYYYLARREGKKVKFIYKGPVSTEIRKAYREQRKMLRKYKGLIAQVKKQIGFLKKALRANKPGVKS
ncbi:hypothetical protein L6386_04195 [bacterium]|nr:hypothetical protein [Candidatus Omnitrophota bacterium]MCG2677739.1 hypothetical protein [bacterium]